VMSSTRRTDPPARYISIRASSTELWRRRCRSMIAVSNVAAAASAPSSGPHQLGVQLALVMAGTGVTARFTALIALCIAKPVRFGVQKRVQRLLHRPSDHPIQVILDPLVVNRDDIVQWTRCIVRHDGSLSAGLVAFSHLQVSQLRGRWPYSIAQN